MGEGSTNDLRLELSPESQGLWYEKTLANYATLLPVLT